MKNYQLDITGLAEAVAKTEVTSTHAKLIQVIRSVGGYGFARLATKRGDSWYARRKVIAANGSLVHEDHEAWLKLQMEADGGSARKTRDRLRAGGYRLTKCELTTLYVVHDRQNENHADFVQLEVVVETERVDCELFSDYGWSGVVDLRDLLSECEGSSLSEKSLFRPVTYSLQRGIDVGQFMDELEKNESRRNADVRSTRFKLTDMQTGKQEVVTADQLDPGWDARRPRARRLFLDWARSSAGRSGARFCDNWVARIDDYTDPQGSRWMGLIPMWTLEKKLAEIDGTKGSNYELFAKLEKLDQRVKVPFAWYFFMLHGNRMKAVVARRITKAAEAGLIVIPEHDYQVLRDWAANEYGF